MNDDRLDLRPAEDDDIEYVEALLAANGLPTAGVRSKPACFYVGYADDEPAGDEPIGLGGFEVHGAAGLLRSVVVEESARGRGWGTAICDALEAEAEATGIDALYVLTTTASGFFAGRGYDRVDRSDAPAAIRRTDEFAALCPASAVCMRKRL